MRAEGILHQDLLPHSAYDHRIRLHHLTAKQWGHIAEHLSDEAAPVCGVSVRLSKDNGAVDGVAFATCTDVFYVKFAYAEQNLSFGKSNLARVLNGSLSVLVGFGMARLALHLHRHHGLHVEGVELSTLFTFANKKFQSAADFASRRIHPDVDRSRIHALWYGDRIEDACLRAWLSAVYVQFSTVFPVTNNYRRCSIYKVSLPTPSRKCRMQSRSTHATCRTPTSRAYRSSYSTSSSLKENVRHRPRTSSMAWRLMKTDIWLSAIPDSTPASGEVSRYYSDYHARACVYASYLFLQTSIVMETTHGRTVTGQAVRAEGKQTSTLR